MTPSPPWFPDEVGLAGRENLDSAHVERYDGKMDADPAAEVALLQRSGLTADSVLLEFGPGTGQFTVAAARVTSRVIAVDVSPPMLRKLSSKLSDRRIDNVTLVQAGFLSYQHTGEPVDVVYSRYALHHLPDFWKVMALHRLRRMLRPGGLLRLWDVVYDFLPSEAEASIDAWCDLGGASVEAEWSRAELEEHVRDEHSTFSWLLEAMIDRCGFGIDDVQRIPETFDSKYLLRAR
ncbi:class I SAM-dependent methyltransferase [Planctomonas psychrotolerans]|uniref:class I SAM-dependent methyltransferase n=1 Tax=Planctomonas psychrotolerans TaxID=2528712 RepID=UPI001239E61A|nr:class I SAM-dependent methyltransferase [Planctomonas psychrotolerans]